MDETAYHYPDFLDIRPLSRPVDLSLRVPGSKSLTNRALILAALSGDCEVLNALHSEDTLVMIDSLRKLGFAVEVDWERLRVHVRRPKSERAWIPARNAELAVGNSGTSMRFLTALCCLGSGEYRLDGIARMRERPIRDLLDGLGQLGVVAASEGNTGCPPVVIGAKGLRGGQVKLNAGLSSQFASALLLVLPFADGDSVLELTGEIVSEPYIAMTVKMLHERGITVRTPQPGRFEIPGGQRLNCQLITVEPDASSASYFLAAAAISGGGVTVFDITTNSLQGDVKFADALERMGCSVERLSDRIAVRGAPLKGIDIDMNAISDTAMTLAAVACFAVGETTIRNVGHIRHKETDRIEAMATELRKAGQEVETWADGLTIRPRPIRPASLATYNDHRMAMSFALLGLKAEGIRIENPGCVAKTYPGFWIDFEKLYA